MKPKIRINRFLARAGLGSRRRCEDLIRKGSIYVNGARIEDLAFAVDPLKDRVEVDGRMIEFRKETIILVLNKPRGVLSTVKDDFGRKTVIDIAVEHGFTQRLFPVGRLDLNTTGILLLTDDGELSHRLMHPRFKIEKRYTVRVEGVVSADTARSIASGTRIGDFTTSSCRLNIITRREGYTDLEIILKEGKKRQIRRIFAHFGHRVIELHRASLGALSFEDLAPGDVRPLTPEEEAYIKKHTGLA